MTRASLVARKNMEKTAMKDSVIKIPLVELQTDEVQMKIERRELLWHFLIAFGVIAGAVTVATMIAHWTRPLY